MEQSYRFFENKECKYFPCHKGLEEFNCLFCYCPLYALGEKCGGNFRYTEKGVKDCTNCILPHSEGGYEHVMAHIKAVLEMGSRSQK